MPRDQLRKKGAHSAIPVAINGVRAEFSVKVHRLHGAIEDPRVQKIASRNAAAPKTRQQQACDPHEHVLSDFIEFSIFHDY